MEPEIIQGLWEEVASRHAAALKGHRVEVRIIDGKLSEMGDASAFEDSLRRIGQFTRGAAPIAQHPLNAHDFYESAG